MSGLPRYSGLQREVFSLYKDFLKFFKSQPKSESTSQLLIYMRDTFKEKAKISKRDIRGIEYLVGLGRRQLKTLQKQGISGFSMVTPRPISK